jgi:Rad3-related DNA helicase
MTRNGIEFQAIWPGRYAERYLWSGVEKIVLISATLRPKALEILGLKPNDYRFKEWPRIFPAANNPVVWVPTGRMGRKADDTERMKSVDRFDEVFEEYGWEKKGIVQVPSYKLAEWLRQHSRFGKFMHINKSGEAVQTAEEFRKAKAPAVLVSPSFTEGWDFADDACEWIVVLKLPYPDQSDPVIVARSDSDREFYDYVTMQTLVQECGRGCRHEADKCIVIITDDAVGKFRKYAAKHAPSWFGIKEVDSIPKVDTLK